MGRFYDFLVVGGGSAGCVVANRLSADRTVRVALIEAGGGNRGPIISMPVATDFYGIGNPLYDWGYRTQPDASRKHRAEIWPRGKGLGGSSAINGLVFMQGLPADFEGWGDGWSWADVSPACAAIHRPPGGTGGMVVSKLQAIHPTTELFVASARKAGLRFSEPLWCAPEPGVGYVEATYERGRRVSNSEAFLKPVRERSNLTVLTRTQVLKIMFEGCRATGVTCRRFGREMQIRAGHIILAAGTIATPQLLLASGIGPAPDLRRLNIEVVAHRPGVGANLHDHPSVYLAYEAKVPTLNAELAWSRRIRHGLEWWWRGTGIAASPGGQALAYLRTTQHVDAPDVQVQFTPIGYALVDGQLSVPRSASVTAVVSVNRPFSRGRVSIASPDIRVPPLISPCLFSDTRDMVTLREGLRQAARLMKGSPLASVLGARMPHTPPDDADDTTLEEYIRTRAGTNFHPVGTCRIGHGCDDGAVVDTKLRLHGIEGLTVADASVMPRIVSTNINATVTMIGERAAGFLTA